MLALLAWPAALTAPANNPLYRLPELRKVHYNYDHLLTDYDDPAKRDVLLDCA